MDKKVVMYTTPTCHFCHLAKDFFKTNNVAFEEYDVAVDQAKAREMVEKSGQMGVPVIMIDDQIIVGFDESGIRSALGL
ncbi:MAG: NrdH-redoxin [Candidatus Vogelbacteria bacterium RIFOXYD1_FULL_46_19]|uniref:NrdH-redoxin n=1 Tax=Candidatus Vogelbacteria bacterium RIFOXYD1_FULL_46_19 TaxID=1802439 RepID=A0A1G2QH69_9BACT|nr:MAG: NrdH-redoxin [Candidatus Vogelbacteria bacterium RIFOXYD1_FULL_46_19]